ncbi:hypothetical protein E2C01_000992 [Portunus trituberculatus]|uniref:Uncharacterized protein n=1 Tax=Portunus trituberculatus TaxID=210409 RepID=A0A5B7CJ35_PORTR|nr:hypothetical protein [Portunus trituberculatus]
MEKRKKLSSSEMIVAKEGREEGGGEARLSWPGRGRGKRLQKRQVAGRRGSKIELTINRWDRTEADMGTGQPRGEARVRTGAEIEAGPGW